MKKFSIALSVALLFGMLAVPVMAGEVIPGVDEPASRDIIPDLIAKAKSGYSQDRIDALSKLGSITDERRLTQFDVPAFLLKQATTAANNSLVRSQALTSLGKTLRYVPNFTGTALSPLIASLHNRKTALHAKLTTVAVIGSLIKPREISHRPAFQALLKLTVANGTNPSLVGACLTALGSAGYSDALPVVLTSIRNKNVQIREAALVALEALLNTASTRSAASVVNTLVAIVIDDKVPEKVKIKAMKALVATLKSGVKVDKVSGPLVRALGKACDKKEPILAEAVVGALSRVADGVSIAALKKAYATFSSTPGADGFEKVRIKVALTVGDYIHPLVQANNTRNAKECGDLLLEICRKEPQGFTKAIKAAMFGLKLYEDKRLDRRPIIKDMIDAMAHDKDVAKEARAVLVHHCAVDKGNIAKTWQEWFKKNRARFAPIY
jgi:hypothetical protein